MSAMRILHYIPSIDESSGGVGAYMQLLARNLGQLVELHVVTHRSDHERPLEHCQLHYLPFRWLPWRNCRREFLQLLDSLRPDVVHTNCCWLPLSALTAIWAKRAGYRVIYTPHGMLEPYILRRSYWTKKLPAILLFQRRGVQVCDLVHTTAESERQHVLALGWNPHVAVIPNCVQLDDIALRTSWQRSRRLLFLSRVHPKKGLDLLIEAISQLRHEMQGYTLTIAGTGEASYIRELQTLTKARGVAEMVEFVGPVYGDNKWPLYRSADLFVLPTHSENFGIVIAEALASGTPVLTTTGTPWEELVSHRCGWQTAIAAAPLADALREFLACTEAELEQMGRRGRQLITARYASEAVAAQMVTMYGSLR